MDLYKYVEDLRSKDSSDLGKAKEILSSVLDKLQIGLKDLSSTEELLRREECLYTLALSTFESIAVSVDGLVIEANSYIAKPVQKRDLADVLKRCRHKAR